DARKLIERQNIAAAGEEEDEAQLRRAPKDWVLLRRRPDGEEVEVATSVVAFELEADGNVVVSDGDGVLRVTTDDKKRISTRQRVMSIVSA
ncbi:MAG: hypothetical protein K0S65_4537, partial [Labilithrix sp.]|nr:hypothetical protein [Labilithrix sp.]